MILDSGDAGRYSSTLASHSTVHEEEAVHTLSGLEEVGMAFEQRLAKCRSRDNSPSQRQTMMERGEMRRMETDDTMHCGETKDCLQCLLEHFSKCEHYCLSWLVDCSTHMINVLIVVFVLWLSSPAPPREKVRRVSHVNRNTFSSYRLELCSEVGQLVDHIRAINVTRVYQLFFTRISCYSMALHGTHS